MKKLGRPPLGDHRVTPFAPQLDRVRPPSDLKPKELAIFRDVLASCPSAQFSPGDSFMLASFARVALVVDRALHDLDKAKKPRDRLACMKMLEQALRLQISLATKLRLTTSSRRDINKLARQHLGHRPPSFYEVMDDDDDDDESGNLGHHDKPA